MDDIKVGLGSKIKINVSATPIGDIHMDNYDFSVAFFTPNGKSELVILKDALLREDADNYVAIVDTSLLGLGRIMFRVNALLPDLDFQGGFREEVTPETKTNIVITK